jgi:RNA polymerase sigma factor (sigma-70 family)
MTNPAPSVLLQHIPRLAGGDEPRSDRELLERFAAGADEPAFAELVRRHGPMVLRVCRRLLAETADAEDAFQAVFLVLAQKAAAVRWRDSVAGWLFRTARHVARRARDAPARRTAHEGRAPAPALATGPVEELTAREWFAVLDEELERLPEKERAPLVLCYLEGLTRDEAARRLGCPLGTLKDRLERGKDRLRRALTRRGVSLPAGLALLAAAETAEAPVPAALAAAAVRAALAGGGSAAAAVLAGAVLNPPLAARLTALALLVLLSGAVAGGVGLLAQKPAEEKAPAAPPLATQAPPRRTDLYGDPLPVGAVARLGKVGRHPVLAVSPDGRLIAAGDAWGRSVRLWELTGRVRGVLPVRAENELLYHLVFSPDGRTLWAAHSGGLVQSWDVVAAKEQLTVQLQEVVWKHAQLSHWPDFFLLSPDARHVLATDGKEKGLFPSMTLNLSIWETAAGKPRWRHELPGDCTLFWPLWVDGRTVALHGDDGLRLLDVETGAVRWRIPGTAAPGRPLAVSADGRLLATDRKEGMDVWETATGKQVASAAVGAVPCAALTPDGRFLVGADAEALRRALNRQSSLGAADLVALRAWPLRQRLMLLSLTGLWEKVPREEWEAWAGEYRTEQGDSLPDPFPPAELEECADLAQRNAVLSGALGVSRNTLSVWLYRCKRRLLELNYVPALLDRA